MKKVIIGSLLIMSIGAQAQSTIEKAAKVASNVIDSGTKAVKDGVHTIDTSGNFKRIYTDLRNGIEALAGSLKVGAEHVYEVLVRQQVVYAVTYLLLLVLLYTIAIILWKSFIKGYGHLSDKDHDWHGDKIEHHDTLVARVIVASILSVISVIATIGLLDDIIGGLVNPEYGAIQDIVEMVKNSTK